MLIEIDFFSSFFFPFFCCFVLLVVESCKKRGHLTTFLPIDPRTAGQFVKVSHDKQYDGFLKPAEFNNIRARVCYFSVNKASCSAVSKYLSKIRGTRIRSNSKFIGLDSDLS